MTFMIWVVFALDGVHILDPPCTVSLLSYGSERDGRRERTQSDPPTPYDPLTGK